MTTAETYLSTATFNVYKNEVGLSAASSSNPVVTKDDIKDLAGAMHFRGAVTPTEGQTDVAAIEAYYTAQGYTKAAGDVVIITTNSKEYVYNGTTWIELGAEDLYALKSETYTKTEVNAISANLSSELLGSNSNTSADYTIYGTRKYADGKVADSLTAYYTKTEVNSISTALSTDYVGKISTAKSEVIGTVDDAADANTIYGAKKYAEQYADTTSAYALE